MLKPIQIHPKGVRSVHVAKNDLCSFYKVEKLFWVNSKDLENKKSVKKDGS
jgi:hypothetical protein